MSLEIAILDFISAHFQSGFSDWLMPIVSSLGNTGIFWIIITAIFLLLPNYRRVGWTMLISLLLSLLFCNILLKPTINRIRPFIVNPEVSLLIAAPLDASFPSGHSSASFAAATALFLAKRRLGILALLLAGLIAFSRLYLYVHFPSDVLAGTILGCLCGYLAHKIVNWLYMQKEKKSQ